MKLYTYLRCRHFVESAENVRLAQQARWLAEQILCENGNYPGTYPTVDSMWRELLRRAKEIDEKQQKEQ